MSVKAIPTLKVMDLSDIERKRGGRKEGNWIEMRVDKPQLTDGQHS